MKAKSKLDCYLCSNLIISILSLNFLVNCNNYELTLLNNKKENTLRAIYKIDSQQEISTSNITTINDLTSITVQVKEVQSQKKINYVKPSYNSLTGSNLVEYAKHYLGLRYVSAGNSLTIGTDCSGFTKLIYQEFGIILGRTVSSQIYSGTYVSKNDLEPGDLVFYGYSNYASHVAIYIGSGLIIHESNPRDGVKISSVNIMNYITARRLITANVVSSKPSIDDNKNLNTNQKEDEMNSNENLENNENNDDLKVEDSVDISKEDEDLINNDIVSNDEIKEDNLNEIDHNNSQKDEIDNNKNIDNNENFNNKEDSDTNENVIQKEKISKETTTEILEDLETQN